MRQSETAEHRLIPQLDPQKDFQIPKYEHLMK